MLKHINCVRFGYRNPVDLVSSRLDTHRATARHMVLLSQRMGDDQIAQIRDGAVSTFE